MRMVSSTLFSVVLAAAMFSVGAVTERVTNVYITNFPLDNQGNIKVSQMSKDQNVNVTNFPTQQPEPSWKVISVVENLNFSWTPSYGDWVFSKWIEVGSVSIRGYSQMKLYFRVINYTWFYQGYPNTANVVCAFASVYEFGQTPYQGSPSVSWYWNTPAAQSLFGVYPQNEPMRVTAEPALTFYLQGQSYTPNGPLPPTLSCLVSIGLYLRSD